jgi:lysophospholipase L1-like esterase
MFKSHWLSKNFLAIGAAVLALSGCGGSSSSSSPPPPPPPPPPANVAPTADAGPDQTVDELAEVTLDGTGSTDTDGTVSSYTWVQTAGTVVTLDETTPANPTFIAPDLAANETLTFQLTVTDDDGDDSAPDTVDINVVANAAPVANAGPDQTVDELAVVTLDGSASTDPDGTIVSYTWTQTAGTPVALDETTPAAPTFTAPDLDADETLTFSLVVADDNGATSAADSVNIDVVAKVIPTANAGPDQVVSSLDVVTLDGSASNDPDGTIATYTWTQTTGGAVTLDESNPAMPTFTAPNVGADEILTFELVVTDNDGLDSLADTVVVTINPTLALPFSDNFNDGDFAGWTIVDDSITIPSSWKAASGTMVNDGPTSVLFADLTETYRRGTYALLADSVNLTNYRFSVDVTMRPTVDPTDDLGVMFRYTDNDHYYRFSINAANGGARLESKAGVDLGGNPIFRTLAYDFRGYEPGVPQDITIEVDGPLIQVFVNGDDLFAVYDQDHPVGGVALYTRDGIRFDNVSITQSGTAPEIVIASPVANFVIPDGPRNIDIIAIARNIPPGTGSVDLEFVGEAPCGAITESRPGEWVASCPNRAIGNHQVRAKILDNGIEVDRDTNEDVFLGAPGLGDRYDAIGDSLTLGLYDNFRRDNLNLTDRKTISTRGWTGPLSDLLTSTLGQPNLVGNEGVSGDRSWQARILRLDSIIERNKLPKSNRALVMLGTNDSNVNNPEPSGEGCVGEACNGTYKGYMTDLITQLQGAGRDTVYLSILPPVFGDNTNPATTYTDPLAPLPGAARNNLIQEYNRVIINELSVLPGVELGPDLFSCFLTPTVNRFSLFEDTLHMNSLGYALVAALWHDAITAGPVVPPMDPCPSPIYILEGLDPYAAPGVAGFKQNLLEEGDLYYRDETFTLTNVPAELADGIWVTPRNADNTNTDADFLSFDAGTNPVTVYIAYDPAGSPPTSSTHTFSAATLSSNLTVSDGSVGTFSLVRATGVTGTVTIGGTLSTDPGIARQAYLVIVVP